MRAKRNESGFPMAIDRYLYEKELADAFLAKVAIRMEGAGLHERAAVLRRGQDMPERDDLIFYAAEAACCYEPVAGYL